jgi:metal-dependent amidase/aminoacylase/carboxypeptidase family protein
MDDIMNIVSSTIDQESTDLNRLSQSIWNQPELGFKEHFAHTELTDFLEKTGFIVEKSFKLETAFRATYTHNVEKESVPGPNIAVLCEYDALPGIGHACGHNLIAELGVASALAIKAAMIANPEQFPGTVSLIILSVVNHFKFLMRTT